MNYNQTRQVVFITGASSGIGAALAREYARRRTHLALFARRQERLQAVAKECQAIEPSCRVVELTGDVTKADDLREAVARATSELGRIDTVVANAGFSVGGNVEDLRIEDYQRQFATNVEGVLHTLYATLSELKQSRGRLAIIGSVNSYVAAPNFSAYCMSKFAVRALADSLRYELQPYGISVTLLCPGFVESEIRRVDDTGVFRSEVEDFVPSWLYMRAERAARGIAKSIEMRRREAIITLHAKVAVFCQRHFPWMIPLGMKFLLPAKVKKALQRNRDKS